MDISDFPSQVAAEIARLETEIGVRCREIDRLSAERDDLSRLLSHVYVVRDLYEDVAVPKAMPVCSMTEDEARAARDAIWGPEEPASDAAAEIDALMREAMGETAAEPAPFVEAVAELVDVVAELALPDEPEAPAEAAPKPKRHGKTGNPNHVRWTEDDDTRCAELWNGGASAKKIAAELGRTPQAVVQRMVLLRSKGVHFADHGVGGSGEGPARPYTAEDDATIIRMRGAGHSFKEIGTALGRTAGGVRLRHAKLESTVAAERIAQLVEAERAKAAPVAAPAPVDTPAPEVVVPSEPVAATRSIPEPVAPPAPRLPIARTMPAPAPRAVATNMEAAREVARSDQPIMGRASLVDTAPAPKAGTSDLRRRIAAHLDQVGYEGGWTPRRDLDLFEGVCAGQSRDTARRLGVTVEEAAGRFILLSQPIRDPRRGNSASGQEVTAELLRERAAQMVEAAE